jgi:hypothetical protein
LHLSSLLIRDQDQSWHAKRVFAVNTRFPGYSQADLWERAMRFVLTNRNRADVRILVEAIAKEQGVPLPADWKI